MRDSTTIRSALLGVLAIAAHLGRAAPRVDPPWRPEGRLLASVPLADRPFGVAVSPQGIAYVARLDADAIAVVRVRDRASLGTIAVGRVPTGVAFDAEGEYAYVANQESGNVGIVRVRAGRQVGTIDVAGAPFVVRVARAGDRVYVVGNANAVSVASVTAGTVLRTIPIGIAPNGFAVDLAETRMYVAAAGDGRIVELDMTTDAVRRVLSVDGRPQELVLSDDGRTLFVANESGWLDVVSVASGERTARVDLAGGGFGMALAPDGRHLFVSVPSSGLVQVVDTRARRVTHAIDLGGRPRRIAFDHRAGVAVVANEAGAMQFVR